MGGRNFQPRRHFPTKRIGCFRADPVVHLRAQLLRVVFGSGREEFLVDNPFREGGVETFEKFGLDRDLIRRALSEALRNGGDFADLFAQHSTGSSLGLEDGAVNRAAMSVDLGAGIRVVVGDQTGYAFTEELTAEALLEAARIAASIAAG